MFCKSKCCFTVLKLVKKNKINIMAIVQNPLIGRARKQAGGVVFTKIYDKNVIRSKPQAVTTSPSFNQQLNRDYFKLVTRLVAQLTNEELEIMYPEKPKKGTRKQLLTRTLLKNKKKENGRYVPDLQSIDNLGIIDPYFNPEIQVYNYQFLHLIQPMDEKTIQNDLNNEYFSFLIFDDVNEKLKLSVSLQGKSQEFYYYYLRDSKEKNKVFNIRRFLTDKKISKDYIFKTALNNLIAALITDYTSGFSKPITVHENSIELTFKNLKDVLNTNFVYYENSETPFLNIQSFDPPIYFFNNIVTDVDFLFIPLSDEIKIEVSVPNTYPHDPRGYDYNLLVTNISKQESIFLAALEENHFEPYPAGWEDSDAYNVLALYKVVLATDPKTYTWGYIKQNI